MSEIKALIPVMTSNTEPSGVVEYSSVWTSSGNYKGYHAFDNDDSTYWASANRTSGEWLQYEFSTPQNVTGLFIDAGNEGSASDSYKLQCYDGSDWVDLTDYRAYGNGISDNIRFDNNRYAIKYRVIFGGASTHNTRTLQLYGPDGHSSYIGDIEAIRDWLNASLYNKEEIEDLFIQNNQQGLIPYDLTIEGYEPEQYVKLVGQTSGKTYNICLAALMGDSMGKAKIYDPVINSDVLNSVNGKIFVKGNIAFCNVQPSYKTTSSSNKHIFTIPEEIRPRSFVTFETGDGAHTNACGYGYIDPTDGKVYTSNEHNTYQYMSMCWLIPDETVNFKSQDSSVESMLGGVIGIIGKDMAYISTKVHLGSHASGWKVPLLELPESIAPVNNYDFIPVVHMLSAVNGNVNSFRDAHYELNNDKCCVNVYVYDGDYDIWVTGYWKFK